MSPADAAALRISQRRVPPFSKQPSPQERPKQPQRGHRQGADNKGTLAAMKALWRELVDPKIKEHHAPVVKTTRLAAIESLKGFWGQPLPTIALRTAK